MTFVITQHQIDEMTAQRTQPVVRHIVIFLRENCEYLSERNLDSIDETHVYNILQVSREYAMTKRGTVKSLALLIYKYSTPMDYLNDQAFAEEMVKTGISPEIRIMNIHDTLKIRIARNSI